MEDGFVAVYTDVWLVHCTVQVECADAQLPQRADINRKIRLLDVFTGGVVTTDGKRSVVLRHEIILNGDGKRCIFRLAEQCKCLRGIDKPQLCIGVSDMLERVRRVHHGCERQIVR